MSNSSHGTNSASYKIIQAFASCAKEQFGSDPDLYPPDILMSEVAFTTSDLKKIGLLGDKTDLYQPLMYIKRLLTVESYNGQSIYFPTNLATLKEIIRIAQDFESKYKRKNNGKR